VGLSILVLYFPARNFEFLNFDDPQYVTDNPFVRSGLSWTNVVAAFSGSRAGHYHPLTWVSHMLDVSLFGLEPGPAHWVNVSIHAVTTALVFALAHRCLKAILPALWVALLFGHHPMRLESVAWIAERKDVLSLLFALITLHAWLSYTRRPSFLRYLGVVLPLVLGLLSKPTLVTLPVLLLGLDYWPVRRSASVTRLLLEKVPLGVLALAAVVVTTLSQQHAGALTAVGPEVIGERITTAAVAALAYAGKLFWPVGLGIFYPLAPQPPGVGAGAVLGLIALSWVCLSSYRERPALAFGWLWFMVAPLPVLGLVQFGGQAFADRWTYLAHLGLVLGLVATLRQLLAPRAFHATCGTLSLACCLYTALELPHWRDSESIFRHTLAVSPNNFMAHTNLGSALDRAGRLPEAATHYEEAARLNPTYPEALNNLGILRARNGRLEEAAGLFTRALSIRPEMALARYNLGLVKSDLGKPLAAATQWLETLSIEPRHALALKSLRATATRSLEAACDGSSAQRLNATNAERAAYSEALTKWTPLHSDPALYESLSRVQRCLGVTP
jgi:protein O-mannosyl-transferase